MNTLTTAGVADLLGTTPRHVARLVEAGRLIPAVRAPGRTGAMSFTMSEVERYRRSVRRRLSSADIAGKRGELARAYLEATSTGDALAPVYLGAIFALDWVLAERADLDVERMGDTP
jgi:hypothetical protein